jgi:hypothetical protein
MRSRCARRREEIGVDNIEALERELAEHGETLLFDLAEDPFENSNLAKDSAGVVSRLEELLPV